MENRPVKKKRRTLRAALIAAAAVAVAAALAIALFAGAVWNEDRAVHVTPGDIENSTLAIGTHLIHLSALTQELYDIAQASADESGQNSVYYKSELAEGTWFDITTASTLNDITNGGSPVTEEQIRELFFEYHTKSDGVTYDLRTGQPVNIFDIRDPYDLETMEELMPLKTQYDLIVEQQSDSAAGRKKISDIEEIFSLNVNNSVTAECDKGLDALQVYYDVLAANNGGTAELGIVQEVMDAVDASRRATVYSIIKTALDDYSIELSSAEDSEDDEGNVIEDAGQDTNLQSAVSDSLTNISTSLIEYQGKMLDEGTTVMSKVKYRLSEKLIGDAEAPNHSLCDEDVAQLLALSNIMDSVVASKNVELSLLEDTLLGEATNRYKGGLGAGQNSDYNSAVAKNSAKALLNGIISTNKSTLNTYRSELEFFIEAECLRLSNADATTFIEERLRMANGFYSVAPGDAFKDSADETVQAHIDYLTKKLRELELAAGGNELDKLAAEKSDVQKELLAALDKNNLALASQLEEKIGELDDKMSALMGQQNDALKNLNGELNDLKEQLKKAQSSTGSGKDVSDEEKGALKEAIDKLNDAGTALGADLSELIAKLEDLRSQIESGGAVDPSLFDEIGDGLDSLEAQLGDAQSDGVQKLRDAIDELRALLEQLRSSSGADQGDQALIDSLNDKINAAETNIKTLEASMTDGSLGELVATLKAECLDVIAKDDAGDEDMDTLSEDIGTLGDMLDMDYALVFQALKDVYSAMVHQRDVNESDAFGGDITQIEELILNNRAAYDAAMRDTLTTEDMEKIEERFFTETEPSLFDLGGEDSGEPWKLSEDEKKTVAIAALQMYSDETMNDDAAALAAAKTQTAYNLGSKYVFAQATDVTMEFLPLTAIHQLTGMRYVWNRNLNRGTLARGASYYEFTVYSDEVVKGKTDSSRDYMSRSARYQDCVYIPEDYSYQEFGVEAVYVGKTNLAVAVTDELSGYAAQLFEDLLLGLS